MKQPSVLEWYRILRAHRFHSMLYPRNRSLMIFRPLEIERRLEMRPSPACQQYAQSDANDCRYPQRRRI
jgi:hypothetical protein